jgi:hypothetical protein
VPDTPLGTIVAILFALFALLAIGAFPALLWWRSYFRTLFERRFEPQADGTYIAHWIPARGQPAALYRVDAALKERMVAALVKGSVISTALFVVLIIGMIVVNVVLQTPLAMLGVVPIGVLVVALQRRLHRRFEELLGAALPVDSAEHEAPPRREAPANLRPLIVVSLLCAVTGGVVVAIFFNDPDADKAAFDASWLALTLLLVGLPLAVALLGLWAARRQR